MVFSSLMFLFRFLPAVLLLYFLAPKRARNTILFLASLIFYAWGEPVYVVLMLFSTVVDYTHGRLVYSLKQKNEMKKAKLVVASSMIINLALLGFFKYADFIIGNLNLIPGVEIPLLNLALPIGISFYTFQTMSYTIDIYRGDALPQKNIISFGAYVALFPQLIAGPIIQYNTVAEQLEGRKETIDDFAVGVTRFMTGLGKKVLLANNIGLLWDMISARPADEVPVLMAWLGITAFAFQIYFDFSGYSDMAIGLGKMLGFHFLENFDYPYISRSITEFWRRWHMSLGSWFRSYVYIPLGGNRKGFKIQIRNIAIVWLLTGIWHGASWNFLVWGAYFGILLILEKLLWLDFLKKHKIFSHIYTIFLVWIGWTIFAFDNMAKGAEYMKAMFGLSGAGFVNTETMYLLFSYAVLLLVLIVAATPYPKKLVLWLQDALVNAKHPRIGLAVSSALQMVFVAFVFLISTAYLVDATYNPFLYFRF
ncbi:MAG: MBOAT family O-acyltransferase [Lachnospiraceae bacterium]